MGLLTPLGTIGLAHPLSIFADVVMLFMKPTKVDIEVCSAILEHFGEASGLRINRSKCVVLPIQCEQ